MTTVANSLRKVTATFNSESLRETIGRTRTMWLDEIEKVNPQMLHDFQQIVDFADYALDKLLTDSRNSSKPPSQDPNRERKQEKTKKAEVGTSKKKPGAQKGHKGSCLRHVSNPDNIIPINFSDSEIEQNGWTYRGEYEARQVFDIKFSRYVTEYRAQICYDKDGKRHVAPFPEGVNSYAQYGLETKALATNLLLYQMVPYERTTLFFDDIFGFGMSQGVIKNFINNVYDFVNETFVIWAKYNLLKSELIHVDETPLNIGGKYGQGLIVSNGTINLVQAYENKKIETIKQMGILPNYNGIVMSDCYNGTLHFTNCTHALCCVHLLRDLTACSEKEGLRCAELLKKFFLKLKERVEKSGILPEVEFKKVVKHYKTLITKAYNEIDEKREDGMTVTKSNALINRLVEKREEYLLFAKDARVPFDNMIAERGIRMLKVRLKISGCFKSVENADQHCVIRSYIDTCRNYGVTPHDAIRLALAKRTPDFINLAGLDKTILDLISNNDNANGSGDNSNNNSNGDMSKENNSDCDTNNTQMTSEIHNNKENNVQYEQINNKIENAVSKATSTIATTIKSTLNKVKNLFNSFVVNLNNTLLSVIV